MPSKIIFALFYLVLFVLAFEKRNADTFLLDEDEPKYEVVIKQGTHSAKEFTPEQIKKLITLNLNGEDYLCSLPDAAAVKNKTRSTTSYHVSARDEVLSRIMLMDDVCFYRMSWWWVYELCVNKHVRQFHQEQDKVTAEFYLGHFAKGKTLSLTEKDAQIQKTFKVVPHESQDESYASVTYKDGTPCDLTNTPRQTEVRFYCPSEDRVASMVKQQQSVNPSATINKEKMQWIESVEEPATCTYVLKFYTHTLCDIGGFEKEKDEKASNKIQCVALLPQVTPKKKTEKDEKQEQDVKQEAPKQEATSTATKQEEKQEAKQETTTTSATSQQAEQHVKTETMQHAIK